MARTVATSVRSHKMAYFFLIWDTVLVVLLALLLYLRWRHLSAVGKIADPLAGVLPLVVPWAGALGGVTVSLVGCAKHNRDWDNTWNPWHFARPVLGAISGTCAFFIVVVVLRTAGGLKESDTALVLSPVSIGLFFVIAFVCGFRDKLFLELVGKVAEVLFSNGDAKDEPVAYTLTADRIDFGDVPLGQESRHTVRLTLTSGQDVTMDASWVSIAGDDAAGAKDFAQTSAGVLALGATGRDIDVVFTPSAAGPRTGRLTTSLKGITRTVELLGNGVAVAVAVAVAGKPTTAPASPAVVELDQGLDVDPDAIVLHDPALDR